MRSILGQIGGPKPRVEVFQRRVHVSDEHTCDDQQANPKLGDGRQISYYSRVCFPLRVHSYLKMGHDLFSQIALPLNVAFPLALGNLYSLLVGGVMQSLKATLLANDGGTAFILSCPNIP